MRIAFTLAALAVSIALAACSRTIDPPTADETPRELHANIVSGANTLLRGDRLAYFATGDEAERTRTRCRAGTCAIGFLALNRVGDYSVESTELTLLRERRGVRLIRQERPTAYLDAEAYGGWLEHSLFVTRQSLMINDSIPGMDVKLIDNYSLGFSTGENPSAVAGSARWEGLMLGREVSASPNRGQAIRGDADVTVEFSAGDFTADVEFTRIVDIETGDRRGEMTWRGLALEGGGFARRNAPDDTIAGRFYGPNEEEVGGIFERDGVAGAFGGRRTSAP